MERSIETKLAAAVAVTFAALSMGAFVQARYERGSGATAYSRSSDLGLGQVTVRRLNISWATVRDGTESTQFSRYQ